jgi:hypothetical protein
MRYILRVMRNCWRDGDVAMWKNEANQVVGLRQRGPDLIGWMVGSGGPIFVDMDTVILDLGKFEVTTYEGILSTTIRSDTIPSQQNLFVSVTSDHQTRG